MKKRATRRALIVGVWAVLWLLWSGLMLETRAASALSRRQWIKRVGSYRLVKWGNPSTSGLGETLIIRDAKNREVVRLKDHSISFVYSGDLTGDGFPEVILQTWYSGAHSSYFYYVYSLGPSPRCLLKYDKNNSDEAGLIPDFRPKDLDGDGIKEIVSWYDGFAYNDFGDSDCAASYAGAARVPVVFEFKEGRYREATSKFRPFLNALLARTKAVMRERYKEVGAKMKWRDAFQTVLQCYVVLYQLDGAVLARRRLGSIIPREARATFGRHVRQFDGVLASRQGRYSYPKVYAGKAEVPHW